MGLLTPSLLSILWWMPNLVSKGFHPSVKTGTSRPFQGYLQPKCKFQISHPLLRIKTNLDNPQYGKQNESGKQTWNKSMGFGYHWNRSDKPSFLHCQDLSWQTLTLITDRRVVPSTHTTTTWHSEAVTFFRRKNNAVSSAHAASYTFPLCASVRSVKLEWVIGKWFWHRKFLPSFGILVKK